MKEEFFKENGIPCKNGTENDHNIVKDVIVVSEDEIEVAREVNKNIIPEVVTVTSEEEMEVDTEDITTYGKEFEISRKQGTDVNDINPAIYMSDLNVSTRNSRVKDNAIPEVVIAVSEDGIEIDVGELTISGNGFKSIEKQET